MLEFGEVARARRSIRSFCPDKPVARSVIVEALELATVDANITRNSY
jgi:nitroreductase